MLRGFYSAAAGMIAQQRRTEMLSNNIANASTPGFKADQGTLRAFPEMLMQRMEAVKSGSKLATSTPIGGLNTGVYMQETIPLYKQGDIRETGRNTDIALIDGNLPINEQTNKQGSLFFTVQNADGDVRYTRNGNFTMDPAGYLTTNEGYYVLDATGNRIPLQSDQFQVSGDGTIVENGTPIARINIAYSDNPYELVKEGNGLYRTNDNNELPDALDVPEVSYSMKQGFIEGSNVDVAQSMTDMMTAYRAFEANQKILQAYDKSMDKAVNEIGRLR
ncbi:flagellar hook-basal body protein [Ferdinandcohnia quinoae]|uniref:Flagellar hook-basal body protein n=1 Tax=Fredinandcohnia quinoae TaxID=2918902 RepID=A0AAW5DXU8_9BACI|nr:flagellar hook-basal body protein [Fredinandcohnia sp. SECRCQ15]MCH1625178.1 flagellar hook-basal body protein [Fredinandcohnia sp. SECRCQ15]